MKEVSFRLTIDEWWTYFFKKGFIIGFIRYFYYCFILSKKS